MDPLPPPVHANERVLCQHENKLYEGIVKELKYNESAWQCLIHFIGWNARHDEWVSADAIVKYNPKKRALADANNNNNANEIQRPKKRIARKDITLPFTLKTILMEEYDCISVRNWVHKLPAVVPIRKLLNHFRKKNEGSEDFVESIVQIFQEALPKCLLYEQERAQYKALKKDQSTKYVDIYGCEFLLRLAVQIPMHLPYKKFQELLFLMQKNKVGLFPTTLASTAHPAANYEARKTP